MRRGGALLALAATAAFSTSGCSQQILIGVVEGESEATGSGGATSSTTASGGATADGTVDGTASGGAGTQSSGGSDSGTASEDGTSSSTGPIAECEAPPGHTVCDFVTDPGIDPELMFHAIGLSCEGNPFETYPISSPSSLPPEANSFRVFREYGNPSFGPSEGSNVLGLTTGIFGAPDGSGVLVMPPGSTDDPGSNNGNPTGALPAPILAESGSAGGAGGSPFVGCDGVGDCSETLPPLVAAGGPARNTVSMSFDIEVPPGTLGYRVDLAWFSAEYPARADTFGTDVAVWWQSSEAFTGNVATLDGAALSASELAAWLPSNGLFGDAPELVGTGYEGTTGLPCAHPTGMFADCPRGASTGWLTMNGPSMPGETMTMVVTVFDLVDTDRDTALLVDNWRWHCEGCEPGTDCGLSPIP